MAFTEQEQAVIEWGLQNGKSKEEVKQALIRLRTGVQAEQPQEPAPNDIAGDVSETVSGIGKAFGQAGQGIVDTFRSGLDPFQKTIQIGSQAFRGGARAFGEAVVGAGKALLPQQAEEAVGGAVQAVGEHLAARPGVQELIEKYNSLDPETKRNVDNALGYTEGLAEILTGGAASRVAAPAVKATKEAATRIAREASSFSVPKPVGTIEAVTDVAKDVIPTRADIRDRFVAGSLRLAPVEDIARIKEKTGNDIGDFLGRYNLIKNTPAQTLDALHQFKVKNYNLVRDSIALVEQRFKKSDLQQIDDSIDFLLKDLADRKSPEYQQAYNRLLQLRKQEDFDLMDAQYVKEVFDDVESVYKRTGEVRDAVAATDKAQTIRPLRRFIEDIVEQEYPDIDIRELNRNVMTAREIADAVIHRSGKQDTGSVFNLGDLAVVGAGNFHLPGAGYAAFFGKKLLESAPIQLRMARAVDAWLRKGKVDTTGLTPQEIEKINKLISDELGAQVDITAPR